MATTKMRGALRALRQGEITFGRFEAETRREWDKLAGKLFGRWRLPAGVSEEDVRQEMLLGAWRAVVGWDPTRGVRLEVHVVWSACSRAKKWLHQQRKAKRRDGSAPSRHPVVFGALRIDADGELTEAELVDLFASAEPEQEARLEHKRLLELVEGTAETALGRDALKFWALSGGDVVEAGVDLFLDPVAQADHGLGSPRQGVRAVERAVAEAMKAAQAAAEA